MSDIPLDNDGCPMPRCPECSAYHELVRPGKTQPTCLCEAYRFECERRTEAEQDRDHWRQRAEAAERERDGRVVEADTLRRRSEALDAALAEARKQERVAWAMLTDPKCMQGQPKSALAAVAQAVNVYLGNYEHAETARQLKLAHAEKEQAEQQRDAAVAEVGRIKVAARNLCERLTEMGYGASSDMPLPGEFDTLMDMVAAIGRGGGE